MFESKLNKDLVKFLAACFGLLKFADILINRALIPDMSINILLFISAGGFLIIIIKNYFRSVSTESKNKSNTNLKTSVLILLLFLVSISNINRSISPTSINPIFGDSTYGTDNKWVLILEIIII